ncbi:hypothetical protein [Vibrio diabolicus]|uniref:hypothetical protein n=1 Tax=Vibrio diabolicus TaxID=50719 RepID=UPI00248138F2|nr:hypothetical protein [Vibrio diabolicus]
MEPIVRAVCYILSPLALWRIRKINARHRLSGSKAVDNVPFLPVYFSNDMLTKTTVVYVTQLPSILLPRIFFKNAVGIALEDTYYIKEKYKNRWHLHFHELVHIQQWQRLGSRKFLTEYIAETLIEGYRGNRFEVEAYELERRFKCNEVFKI